MFGQEDYEVRLYNDLQQAYRDKYLTFRVSLNALNLGQDAIRVTGVSMALILAAIAAGKGHLTTGDFVMVSAYIAQLFQPLAFLGTSYRVIVRASTDIEKCITLFETKSVVVDSPDAKPLVIPEHDLIKRKKGSIQFENVSFKYRTSDRDTGGVRNLNFHVEPGCMLGVVGTSGAGKRLVPFTSIFILYLFLTLFTTIALSFA